MRKIVIVDDNDTLRHALVNMVTAHHAWIVCGQAANGLQGVQVTAKLKPDAVLLDFKMPLMNGLEAAREIRKNDPSIPIAMYTLDQNAQIEAEARRIGVRRVISKTEMFTSLSESLDDMMTS